MTNPIAFELNTPLRRFSDRAARYFIGVAVQMLEILSNQVDLATVDRLTLSIHDFDDIEMGCYVDETVRYIVSLQDIQHQPPASPVELDAEEIEVWKLREMLKADIYQAITQTLK